MAWHAITFTMIPGGLGEGSQLLCCPQDPALLRPLLRPEAGTRAAGDILTHTLPPPLPGRFPQDKQGQRLGRLLRQAAKSPSRRFYHPAAPPSRVCAPLFPLRGQSPLVLVHTGTWALTTLGQLGTFYSDYFSLRDLHLPCSSDHPSSQTGLKKQAKIY